LYLIKDWWPMWGSVYRR